MSEVNLRFRSFFLQSKTARVRIGAKLGYQAPTGHQLKATDERKQPVHFQAAEPVLLHSGERAAPPREVQARNRRFFYLKYESAVAPSGLVLTRGRK
jgi:hypothetical protein